MLAPLHGDASPVHRDDADPGELRVGDAGGSRGVHGADRAAVASVPYVRMLKRRQSTRCARPRLSPRPMPRRRSRLRLGARHDASSRRCRAFREALIRARGGGRAHHRGRRRRRRPVAVRGIGRARRALRSSERMRRRPWRAPLRPMCEPSPSGIVQWRRTNASWGEQRPARTGVEPRVETGRWRSAQRARATAANGNGHAKKPNILIIWGDDIGWFNISAYNMGVMGYRTPNIDRVAQRGRDLHRLVRPAELYRGPRRVHHRPVADPHRPHQGRPARRRPRPAAGGPDDRRRAEAARLRHRPVRQEPPRRPRRVPADRARLRRVLRQPLSPERRAGAGEPGLSEESRVQEEVRPARRAAQLGECRTARRRSRTPAR